MRRSIQNVPIVLRKLVNNCGMGLTQAEDRGLILAARVGKCTARLIEELAISTEGKTDCQCLTLLDQAQQSSETVNLTSLSGW